jgi:hypothetical protein
LTWQKAINVSKQMSKKRPKSLQQANCLEEQEVGSKDSQAHVSRTQGLKALVSQLPSYSPE